MTNLLIASLLAGAATTYVVEVLDLMLLGMFEKQTIYKFLSLPLSFGGMYALQGELTSSLFVTVPASTFVSLMLVKYLNKPIVTQTRLPRL